MPYVSANGQELYYEERGAGDPVVFSHGLLMDGSMFAGQIEALSRSYRTIAWDERGHGRTRSDGQPFTYWDSARDLLGLLDALAIERAVLAGMSQGGYLSLRATLLAPERVRALVLIDSQAGAESPERRAGHDQLVARWEAGGLSDELAATIAAIAIGPDEALAAPWIARWKRIEPTALRRIYTTLVTRDDIRPRIAEIAVPALVVHGELDRAVDLDAARALAAGLHADLEVVPGAGHGAAVTHPQAVSAPIERFLAALEE